MGSYSGAGGNESYNSSDRSGSYGGGGGGDYGGGGNNTEGQGGGWVGDNSGGGGSGLYGEAAAAARDSSSYSGGGGSGLYGEAAAAARDSSSYSGGGGSGLYGEAAAAARDKASGVTSDTGSTTDTGAAAPTVDAGASDALAASAAGAGDPGTATDAPAAPDTGTQNDAATFTGDASGDVTGTPPGADQVAVDNMLSSPTGPDVPGTQAEAATGAAPTAAGPAGPGAVASGAGAGQDDLLSISGADPLAQDQGAAFDPSQTQTIAGQAPASAYGVGADPSADQGAQFDPTQTTNTYDPSPVAATDVGVNSGQPPADWALSQPQDTSNQLQLDPAAARTWDTFGGAGYIHTQPGFMGGQGVAGGADPTAGQDPTTPSNFTGITSGSGLAGPISTQANNPGAQWYGDNSAGRFGASEWNNIDSANNQIAVFTDPVEGAASNFALLNSPGYVGKSLQDAANKWSNSGSGYAQAVSDATGVGLNQTLTSADMSGNVGMAMLKAQSGVESGTGQGIGYQFGMSDDQWKQAQGLATGSGRPGSIGDLSGSPGGQADFAGGIAAPFNNEHSPGADWSTGSFGADTAEPSQPDNPGTGLGTIGPSQFASAGSMLAPGADASIADTSPTSAASAGSMLPGQTTDFLADPDGTTTDPMSANFQTEFGPPAPGTAPLDPTTAFPGNVSGPPAYYGATQFDPSQTSLAAPGALGPVNAPAPNTPGGAITWDDFLEQQRQLATNMPAGPDPLAYGAPQFDPNQTQTNPPGALGAPFSQPGPVGGMGINIGQAFNSAQTQAAADQALQDLLQQGPSPAPGGMPAIPALGTPAAPPEAPAFASQPAPGGMPAIPAPGASAGAGQFGPPAPAGSAFAPQPTGGMGINLPSMASVMDNPPPAPASNAPAGPQQIPMPPSAPGYYGGLNIDAPQTYGQPTYPVQPSSDLLAPNNQPINPLANAEQIFGPYTPTTPYPANPNVQFGPPNQEAVPAPSPKTVDISMEQGMYLKSHPDVAKSTFDNLNLPPGSTINLPGGYGTVTLPGYGQPITGPDGTVYGTMPAQPMRTAAMGAPGPAQPAGPNADYPQPGYTPGAPFTQQAAPETAAPPASDPLAPPGTSSPLAPGGASPPSTPATAAPSQPQAIAGAGGGGGGGVTGGAANTSATGGGDAQGGGQQKITPQLIQQTMQAAAASSPQVAAAVNGLSQGNQQYVTAYQQSLTSQWSQVLLSQGTTDPTQSPAWPQVQAIIQQQVNQLIVQLGGQPATKAA